MSSTISPNMQLTIPTVSSEPGPLYASEINGSLTLIDTHDHSPGKGIPITPSGMNISSDLAFVGNSATGLKATQFNSQGAVLSTATFAGSLYVVGNELYFNDATGGHQVQITNVGNVNAGAGSITGLSSYPNASAVYNGLNGSFVWQQGVNASADMDFGSAILRNDTVSSYGLTLSPPTLASNYAITLPFLPASSAFLTLDASGVMATKTTVVAADLGTDSVTTIKILAANVTLPKLASDVLTWKSSSVVASGNFVVPTNVNMIYVNACGGGGGGGGGYSTLPGGGGGGGAGAIPTQTIIPVTSGETLAVVIGAGGTGGGAAANGVAGGSTTISRGGTVLFTAAGALAGQGSTGSGGASGGGGAGAATAGTNYFNTINPQAGGGGGGSSGASGGSGAGTQYGASAGAGGAGNGSTIGGGGGGGAGYGSAANGGNFLNNGTASAANSGAGGGGGGGNNHFGGAGGSGIMNIYWLGNP